MCGNLLSPSPKQKKNTSKKEKTFFIFWNFHCCRVWSLFGDKKNFFCHQKVTKLCSKHFEKWKKFSPFFGYFFSVWGGGHKKKNFRVLKMYHGRFLMKCFIFLNPSLKQKCPFLPFFDEIFVKYIYSSHFL